MDLSSLEGPPIPDTRFTNPDSRANDVPHIRLEHVLSPVSPLESRRWNLPPRPASASAIPTRPNTKSPSSTGSNSFWQSINPNENPNSYRRAQQTQSLSPWVSQQTTEPQSTSRYRPYLSSVSAPHQLVWVESEQIWMLTTAASTSTPSPHQRSHSSLSPMFDSGPVGGRNTLSHSRSMDSYPMAEWFGDLEPEDLPPPYEQHIFDQPLGPFLPTITRVRAEDVPHRGSRWAAIGRRVS
ncbi:hypothetical protein BJX70DRAFT_403369 [Aspergillus crustosus]